MIFCASLNFVQKVLTFDLPDETMQVEGARGVAPRSGDLRVTRIAPFLRAPVFAETRCFLSFHRHSILLQPLLTFLPSGIFSQNNGR
jgi:hypothetical protein